MQASKEYGSNPSTSIRDRIVKKYPNVKMVLSGHVGTTAHSLDSNGGGNVLYSVTTLHKYDSAPLRTFDIDVKGNMVWSEIVHTADGSVSNAFNVGIKFF